ncbi:lytic transglycosylase domain-containing protein [Acetobacter thailandicus]|nr:lytic transglycosylase domain-containing protein [Acetobacter thailandicus]MBS0985443.1 lytic transglycosylase domain-containing protein [Acetobacter thailandicus]
MPAPPQLPDFFCSKKSISRLLCFVSLALLSACAGHRSTTSEYNTSSGSSAGSAVDHWNGYILDASQRFSVPPSWIRAVMQQESGGHQYLHGRKIRSVHGAVGLMQIKPDTYHELARRYHLGSDPYDPHDNIMAGSGYIRELSDRFGSPLFLAAYNCGPQCAENHRSRGSSLPDYARHYMASIKPHLNDPIPAMLKPASLSFPAAPVMPVQVVSDTASARTSSQSAYGVAPALPDDTPPPPAPVKGGYTSAEVPVAVTQAVSSSASWAAVSSESGIVQAGAFSTQERAVAVSNLARRCAPALAGSATRIERLSGSAVWRVRFVGVPAAQISSVCAALHRRSIACIPVSQP